MASHPIEKNFFGALTLKTFSTKQDGKCVYVRGVSLRERGKKD